MTKLLETNDDTYRHQVAKFQLNRTST